jgi:hypothetical protein
MSTVTKNEEKKNNYKLAKEMDRQTQYPSPLNIGPILSIIKRIV